MWHLFGAVPGCYFLVGGGVKIFPFLRKMEIRHKWLVWVVYGLYTLTSILMNLHTSLNEETVLTHSDSIMSIMMILLIFGCIAYLRREQKYLQKENQNLLVQQRLMDAYNGALMEQIDLTKKMRHDIANHIQTLEELMYGNIQGERSLWIAEYAKELREQFNRLQNVVYCTNPLVNSVINNKVSRCRKENIRTDIIIHSFDYGKISNYEIISILFNLFDNAIDGCMKICEEKEKFLELICENRASWLFIQMKNSMRSMPETNGGRLKVNRKERITPGIGLAIVGDIVKRHGGLWEYQVSDGVFEIKVALEVDK